MEPMSPVLSILKFYWPSKSPDLLYYEVIHPLLNPHEVPLVTPS